jgi:hypothetical protein
MLSAGGVGWSCTDVLGVVNGLLDGKLGCA